MTEWWEGLSTVLKVLYCIAIPSTILLLLQTLLAVFGAHDGGAGTDISDTSGIDFHGDIHGDISGHYLGHDGLIDGGDPSDFTAMRMFTLQTIVAFLTVSSWTMIVCIHGGMPSGLAFGIGFVIGLIVMIALAKIVQLSARLAENGTLDLKNTLGLTATVYIPVPPKGQTGGKVTVTVQGQFRELSAITSEQKLLPTGTQVRITDIRGDTVVVESED